MIKSHELIKDERQTVVGIDVQVFEDYLHFGYIYFDFCESDNLTLRSETGFEYQVEVPEKYRLVCGSQFNVGLKLKVQENLI